MQVILFGTQQYIFTIQCQGIALSDNTVAVRPACAPKRIPTAQVVPTTRIGDHRQIRRFFHDGIVDGNIIAGRIADFIETEEIQIIRTLCQSVFARLHQEGCVHFKRRQNVFHPKQEYTCVPKIATGLEHFYRIRGTRFFNEFHQLMNFGRVADQRRRQFQISITRLGSIRLDAKGHQLAAFCGFCPFQHRRDKTSFVRNDMVRWRDQHQRLGRFTQTQGRNQNRRRRVSPHRFDQYSRIFQANFGQLIGREKAKIRIGQNHRSAEFPAL